MLFVSNIEFPRRSLLILALIFLAGMIIRFYFASLGTLHGDELITLKVAKLDLFQIISAEGYKSSNPPLYYLLTAIATRVFGFSELGLRAISVIASGFALIAFISISLKFLPKNLVLAAACLATLNPAFVYYAGEARAFSLGAMLFICGTWILLRASQELLTWKSCSAFSAICVLAVYTHYLSGALLMLFGGSVVLLCFRKSIWRWTVAQLAAVLLIVPWIIYQLSGISSTVSEFRSAPSLVIEYVKTPFFFAIHRTFISHESVFFAKAVFGGAIFYSWLIPLIGLVIGAFKFRNRFFSITLILAVVPIVGLIAASGLIGLYDPKYALGAGFGLIMAILITCEIWPGRISRSMLLAALILSAMSTSFLLLKTGSDRGYAKLLDEIAVLEPGESKAIVFSKHKYQDRIDIFVNLSAWNTVNIPKLGTPDVEKISLPYEQLYLIASDIQTDRHDLPVYTQLIKKHGFREHSRKLAGRFWLIEFNRE